MCWSNCWIHSRCAEERSQSCTQHCRWGCLLSMKQPHLVKQQFPSDRKPFEFVVNINHSVFTVCVSKLCVHGFWALKWSPLLCILPEMSPHLLMKVSAARRLIFLLKPLLTIINNKQVEYISSAGSSSQLHSDWMAWPWGWGTALQYLEGRAAEMEMGCFGGNHYQGTQLHLEIVDAISNCHL